MRGGDWEEGMLMSDVRIFLSWHDFLAPVSLRTPWTFVTHTVYGPHLGTQEAALHTGEGFGPGSQLPGLLPCVCCLLAMRA